MVNPNINIKSGVLPVTEFRSDINNVIKDTKNNHSPTLLTQHGKPSAVLLGAEDYQELIDRLDLAESFVKSHNDIEEGRVFSTKEAKERVMSRFKK